MNKKLLIGLGVVAAAGVGYYLWKRSKGETKSQAAGVTTCTEPKCKCNKTGGCSTACCKSAAPDAPTSLVK